MAIGEVVERRLPEALVPALDQTRTVGLVTPGACRGAKGGGSIQAGARVLFSLACWPRSRDRGRGYRLEGTRLLGRSP
jgi:hypothetical protein